MNMIKTILIVILLTAANLVVAAGTAGSQGPTGPAGAKGPLGLKGDKGLQGAVGSVGATGVKGATGPKGDKGPAGASQGLQGVQGPKGDQGPAGSAQAGNTAGDMQYWDGSQWQVVAPPSPLPVAPEMATLHFCNGLPTWAVNCVPVSNGTVYTIGATGPAGGIVFSLTDNAGLHGLEAAPADVGAGANYTWGCWGYANNNYTWTTVGSTGTAVGAGAANTAAIIAACGGAGGLNNGNPWGAGTASNAAAAAEAYVLNGFTDWYLPSRDELNLLYAQRSVVRGFANFYYWSSSENEVSNYAWLQYFGDGIQYVDDKSPTYSVRAVRAF